jgi:hypothetical protein
MGVSIKGDLKVERKKLFSNCSFFGNIALFSPKNSTTFKGVRTCIKGILSWEPPLRVASHGSLR